MAGAGDDAGGLGKTVRLRKIQEDAMQELRDAGVLNMDDANTTRAALDEYLDKLVSRAFRRQEFTEANRRFRGEADASGPGHQD